MQEKLKQLLSKINLSEEQYKFFNNGELDKIIGNTNKDYTVYIRLEELLPVEVYRDFCILLEDAYSMCNSVSVNIEVSKLNDGLLKDYFKYFIDMYKDELNGIDKFLQNDWEVVNNEITIKANDQKEEIMLKSIVSKIIKDLESVGCKNTKINIISNKEVTILDEVKEEVVENVVPKEIVLEEVTKSEDSNVIKGSMITGNKKNLADLYDEENELIIEAKIFKKDVRDTPRYHIITLAVTDNTDSLYCKIFEKNLDGEDDLDNEEYNKIVKNLKEGSWYLFRGEVKMDDWEHELVMTPRDIVKIEKEEKKIEDNALVKRVELHTHTFMSQMDGVVDPGTLVKEAKRLGHKAIAITDHNCVQAYPEVFHAVKDINKKLGEGEEPFKVIYGAEMNLIFDNKKIVKRPTETNLVDNTYVVFDLETTGFNAAGVDSIIEIGAVKLQNGEIIDRFDELIDPGKEIPERITKFTGITTEMVKGKDNEETVVKRFVEWYQDLPLVAHNANFDMSFMKMAYDKYGLGKVTNTVIDTLELSRALDAGESKHGLTDIAKRYKVEWDEDKHHRADYDAEATAKVFAKMINKLINQNKTKLTDINQMLNLDLDRGYHVNILAQNKTGLKNLFKIISLANTTYLYKNKPRIPKSKLEELREGLLIGAGCYLNGVFAGARTQTDEELTDIINFYDYVEVQPLECYKHLLVSGEFSSELELRKHIEKIITSTMNAGKIIVATGDVHHLRREDKVSREIIVNQKVPGGGLHPLAKYTRDEGLEVIPSQHLRTTDEMLEDFSFLDKELAYKIVVENTNKIADMIESIEVIPDTKGIPFSPKIDNSEETVKELVYNKAHELYGEELPEIISKRIEDELKGIINGGFDVIYLIAQKLVKKSNDDGYLVGSRGSVGSSFVATLMGITEVNPLKPHYRCPNCKHSIFELNGREFGLDYSSGYDLPDYDCPKCGTHMSKEGQDMPFATFLGFNADKVPDIDLNFSGLYQAEAHKYTKELFGEDYVYRAGTIGTVADKTAFGFVKGYCETKNINIRKAEIERLAQGCVGCKRTTGQHPGGIVVIPNYKEVFDFTPFQYPADDDSAEWRTTHFDYHAIDECVLKLDILGHDDPSMLRMLQDISGLDVTKIPLDDKDTMKIFKSPEVLGIKPSDINDCPTGTLGVPEFGTNFVIGLLTETKPETFGELVKISGLSHGTDVWRNNAQKLIRENTVEFKEVIGCRDDIMVYLMNNGMEPLKAFKIMEFVRKGKPSKDKETWETMVEQMHEANIAEWYIKSCQKIKYMFPKAHAVAYVISAYRIAWFKVHRPLDYYQAYFSIRCNDFNIESMIKGYDSIKETLREIDIKTKNGTAANKDKAVYEVLQIALEATARGIKFGKIDINKSDAINFVRDENNTLIPPFRTIDGLGDIVAQNIAQERNKAPFISIEDLQKRAKISSTLIEKMRFMGILDGMAESNQISIFDL